MATLTINIGTDLGQYWVLADSAGKTISSQKGSAIIRNLSADTYAVQWGPVAGYTTPPAQTGIVLGASDNGTADTPVYLPTAGTGTITVNGVDTTTASNASWSITPDPGNGNDSGVGDASFAAAPNNYSIQWLDTISGHNPAPSEGPTALSNGGSISFGQPAYIVERGSISIVTTSDPAADWIITGPEYPSGQTFTGQQTLDAIIVGNYTIAWQDNIIGKEPDFAATGVLVSETPTSANGTYSDREIRTVNVDVQGSPTGGGDWAIECVGYEAQFTADGNADATPVTPTLGGFYEGRTYSIVFAPVTGYATPTASNIIASATPQTFVGNYTAQAAGSLTVNILADSLSPTGTSLEGVTWSITGPGGFSYTGTEATKTWADAEPGTYWVDLSEAWKPDFAMPTGYDYYDNHPDNVGGSQNGVWTGTPQALVEGGSLTLDCNFTARPAVDKSQWAMAQNMQPETYWAGSYSADRMKGRTGWNNGGNYNMDDWGWPLQGGTATIFKCWGGVGDYGPQTFHIFWKGSGTIQIDDWTRGGSIYGPVALPDDGTGQTTGVTFTYDVDGTYPQPQNTTNCAQLTIETTGANPNHLRDIEIVHEGALGETTGSPDPTKKDWRNHTLGKGALEYFQNNSRYYSSLRFMGWNHFWNHSNEYELGAERFANIDVPNGSPNHGRALLGENGGTDSISSGEPLKSIVQNAIDLCNATGCGMWFCFPIFTGGENQAQAREIMEMIEAPYQETWADIRSRGGLRPDLPVRVEWANEVWNYSPQQDYARNWGLWYANSATDSSGTPFPMGQRGSVHPGFEQCAARLPNLATAGDVAWITYTNFSHWRLNNLYETVLRDQGKIRDDDNGYNDNPAAPTYGRLSDRFTRMCTWRHADLCYQMFINSDTGWLSDADLVSFDGVNPVIEQYDAYAGAPYSDQPISGGTGNIDADADVFYTQNMAAEWGIADAHPFRTPQAASTLYGYGWLYATNLAQLASIKARGDVTAPNLIFEAYEGGQGWAGGSGDFQRQLFEHWRGYEACRNIFDSCKEADGVQQHGLFHYYAATSYTLAETWAIQVGPAGPYSPFFRALVDFAYDNPKWW